jgi:23S rRNA A2030 N6-methylase RlmJ
MKKATRTRKATPKSNVSMDTKSANHGDRLKHALMLEVLKRCKAWPTFTYAETHGGAGLYSAKGQTKKGRRYIRDLRRQVMSAVAGAERGSAGSEYYRFLKEWWAGDASADEYPGSVLQAARYLRTQGRRRFHIRVTEADAETCGRLEGALSPFRRTLRLRNRGFQHELSSLCENDGLFLLTSA